jgi:hypothetical protein
MRMVMGPYVTTQSDNRPGTVCHVMRTLTHQTMPPWHLVHLTEVRGCIGYEHLEDFKICNLRYPRIDMSGIRHCWDLCAIWYR